MAGRQVTRIGAVGDLHCTKASQGALAPLLATAADEVDVLVLCGDLTDHGLPEEAKVLARELAGVNRPMVGVLGNHDYESGRQDEVRQILADAGVQILDGEATEIDGVGFAGTKGFAGGFGERALAPWGEESIKRFVREAVDEALKLESALARLRMPHRVVILHYSPTIDTVRGEPEAIYPFLGSSRLEEPIDRYSVSAVFHGHAHWGSSEGRTMAGAPVYNVSLPLLRRMGHRSYRVIELEAPAVAESGP